MTDNYINVTVTSKENKRVTVSTQDPGFEVTATTDTGKFWAQTAENWATSETIVDNTDYSSKYYANKAKVNAENARVYEATVKETYNTFVEESGNIANEVRNVGQEGLNSIESSRLNAVGSINTVKNEAIDNINATKINILKDIEFVADGEKEEIQELADNAKDDIKSTGFYMRDDKLYFINSKGEEEEFKSGVEPETLNQFVKKDSLVEVQTVIETYQNGTSWYRVWSDGWCEQGGELSWSNNTVTTISFIKTFKDINYNIYSQVFGPYQNANLSVSFSDKTTSSIKMYPYSDSRILNWQASGYLY